MANRNGGNGGCVTKPQFTSCQQNSSLITGAYLIVYTLMMGLVGLPLFYMELNIGQFASLGPLGVYKFSPIFKGKFDHNQKYGAVWRDICL